MIVGTATIFASVSSLLVLAQDTHDAHDPGHWYDADCCSQQDCKPASDWGAEVVIHPGVAIEVEHEGRTVVIPWNDEDRVRTSEDYDVHLCIVQGDQIDDWHIRCVYVSGAT